MRKVGFYFKVFEAKRAFILRGLKVARRSRRG
jgi:hypothetical protein